MRAAIFPALVVLLLIGCATNGAPRASMPEIPQLIQIDEGYFRGGQPSPAGLEELKRMGIKTIVNLRHYSPAMTNEWRHAQQLGMRWVNIPIWAWWWPTTQQTREFLEIVTDPAQRPVFVHCRQGWNRVGLMTAVYRAIYHEWSPQQGYAEGRRLGLVPWNVMTRYMIFRLAHQCADAGVPHPSSPQATGG
jgi:protein tyrosine phosphatase (PTP) superfamily phosphohydrolase (DUF442 family)